MESPLKTFYNILAQMLANVCSKTPKISRWVSYVGATLPAISGIVLLLHDLPYMPEVMKHYFDWATMVLGGVVYFVARLAVYITPEDEAKQ